MTQRLAYAVAAGLAAFLVVLLGALATYLLLHKPDGTAALAATAAQQVANPAPAPNQPASGAPGRYVSPDGQGGGGSGGSNAYPVSPDQAARIALNSAPGASLLQQPRLVNLRGAAAYEVPLDMGYVYVHASSGQVLYNGTNGLGGQRPRRSRR